jgi:carbon-monoxide dehydrogenase large subunit
MDYPLLRADQMPVMPVDLFETPAPGNPLGVKGVGEAGCIGAPPAVVNAVLDALRGLGVTQLNMPLRPLRVWQAIQKAAQ